MTVFPVTDYTSDSIVSHERLIYKGKKRQGQQICGKEDTVTAFDCHDLQKLYISTLEFTTIHQFYILNIENFSGEDSPLPKVGILPCLISILYLQ